MDIAALNTRTGAERGAFMQLKHPVYGHPLSDDDTGEAVGLMVRGMESPTVQKLARKARTAEPEKIGLDFLCSLVVGVVGLERDGKPLTATRPDLEWLFEQSDSFGEQVLAFAQDRTNFFGQAESA